ncbi:flippase [Thermococcus sibiricus]|uniref:Lipopolysaccharide O-side chain biosynthesis protein (O-antigen transpoter) n=1 Tax=Thermococcus sibiricus (strain DSM 12597 / MM 739) TaxID=604354 RepID=C6A0B5_THESM|nr:flippase [Thermococcus sibiricus]ACS91096.1 Lipopolysaccharide O-side chain biosynthesis protein (O-antigen transpoter) [Thermococcus sibiricus MM 739]
MNTVQRIAKNMAVLFVARVVSMLLGFFYVMYTARYLGPANYGILSFALALTGIFGVIANFGLDPLTVREVARDKSLARKYLANGIVLKLLFGTLTFLIVSLVVNLLGYPEITIKVVYIITISIIIGGINNLFSSIYQAFERMEFMSIGQILQSALFLAFAITAIKLGLNVVHFAMIYLIVNLIVLGYHVVITALKFLRLKIEVDLGFWKSVVREAWPFLGMNVAIMIYFRTDTIMLSKLVGDTAVGIYNAAYKIADLSLLVPSIGVSVVFPVFSRSFKNNLTYFKFLSNLLIKSACYIALPMAIIVTLFSNKIILVIFGQDYLNSISVLEILIWTSAVKYVSMFQGNIMVVINKQKFTFKVTVIMAILNIILNLVLISRYSYVGAAFATLITEITGLTIGFVFMSRWGYNFDLPRLLIVAIATLIMTAILVKITSNVFKAVLLIFIIYLVVVYLAGFTKEDIKILQEHLRLLA